MNKTNMFGRCSCKLYESYGIPCCHIIQVLRAEKQNEIPSNYIMKRWETRCKRCELQCFFFYSCFLSFGYFVSFCTTPFLFYTISLNDLFNFTGNYSMIMKVTYWMKSQRILGRWQCGKRFQNRATSLKTLSKWPRTLNKGWTFYI